MKSITLAAIVMLCGCVAPNRQAYDPATAQIRAQCEYEANAATVNIQNPWELAWQKNSLRDQCMKAKGAQ